MNAAQSLTKNLVAYFQANVAPVTAGGAAIPFQVLGEWPGANIKLAMPSLTITQGNPKLTNLMPYVVSTTAPVANQITTTMVIGEYDIPYQLDLWCRNKLERETVFGLVMAAINKQLQSQRVGGLRIQLPDYFNEWASLIVTDHQFVDDDAGAQRQEWRVKIGCSANVKMLQQVTDYAMISIVDQQTTVTSVLTS